MAKVSVLNQTGSSVGEIELNDSDFRNRAKRSCIIRRYHCSTRFTYVKVITK